MENTKTTNTTKETNNKVRNDTRTPGCPFWFFGNNDSADKDLKNKFEIVDDEKKN